jgi:hypothetical protein
MATVLEECTTEEQRSFVRLSRKAVHNWVEKFSQGCSKVADDVRPGCPVEIATEATVQQVEELI